MSGAVHTSPEWRPGHAGHCRHSCMRAAGMTPLHWAVENGHLAVVEMLMEAGGDAGVKTNAGRTPIDMVSGCQWHCDCPDWHAATGQRIVFCYAGHCRSQTTSRSFRHPCWPPCGPLRRVVHQLTLLRRSRVPALLALWRRQRSADMLALLGDWQVIQLNYQLN